tara:strand:- start:32 stop:493 length:462 start_codon:yes stop_codon:yes gene_type:complete
MKKTLLPLIAIVAIGCSSSLESPPEVEVVVETTVEEINAERGDPCDCIESKIEVIDAFIAEVHEGKFSTSELLNKAFSATMDGCLATLGHVEADLAWSQQLKECESFSTIRDAMIEVKNQVMLLKDNEQNEFVDDIDEGGSTEVLDKLKESAH